MSDEEIRHTFVDDTPKEQFNWVQDVASTIANDGGETVKAMVEAAAAATGIAELVERMKNKNDKDDE